MDMSSITQILTQDGLINPPSFLPTNVHFEVMMGSIAYGTTQDTSDVDIYGFCIPPKEMIFPHLAGEIIGFGRQKKRFEQFQQHHIDVKSHRKIYDITIFNIVRYFTLCMENNPNCIDSLFVPQTCIVHCTAVGNWVRENRKLFLHKGSWFKFKGYSYSQLHKMGIKTPEIGSKRAELVEKFGFDVKFAFHVVRLLYEAEMILKEGDLDLQRHREHLKAIRRGEVSEKDIRQWASEKELALEKVYETSTLRHSPDEDALKNLLLQCLEMHYGSLDKCLSNPNVPIVVLREIQAILDKNRNIYA
jgi:predicted nucleotidyltransferase